MAGDPALDARRPVPRRLNGGDMDGLLRTPLTDLHEELGAVKPQPGDRRYAAGRGRRRPPGLAEAVAG